MSVESKTTFADTPEGQGMCFPRHRSSTTDIKVKDVSEERIRQLFEENTALRAEIKALKNIIKNMNS
jgi:hypothetical protein